LTQFVKIFSVVLLATILILIIVGILAPKNTYFTKTQIIKSPTSVVWRKLTDVENYPTWQTSVRKVVLKGGSRIAEEGILHFYMNYYDSTTYHETIITKVENDKSITFTRIGKNANPLLNNYQTSYDLKRLLDGTTEISVTISYRTNGFITKIYNQLFLRSNLSSQAERNLTMLKSSIESM
jgi:uncharacterized membrane protein